MLVQIKTKNSTTWARIDLLKIDEAVFSGGWIAEVGGSIDHEPFLILIQR